MSLAIGIAILLLFLGLCIVPLPSRGWGIDRFGTLAT
jgi:hypothetical protein